MSSTLTLYATSTFTFGKDGSKTVGDTYETYGYDTGYADKKQAAILFGDQDVSVLVGSVIKSAKLVLKAPRYMDAQSIVLNGFLSQVNAATSGSDAYALSQSSSYVIETQKHGPMNDGTIFEFNVSGYDTIHKAMQYGLFVYLLENLGRGGYGYFYNCVIAASKPYIVIEYDSAYDAPTVSDLNPRSDIVDGTKSITFSWSYAQSANSPQSHYAIQTSADGLTWTDTVTKVASHNQYHVFSAGTFTAGNRYWRVKVYSQNGTIESAWSDPAYIVIRAYPTAPNITAVTSTPRPTVTWASTEQQGYQCVIGDYDTGTVWGSARSVKIPYPLPDGSYTVKVRVVNSLGLWSAWSSSGVTISNTTGDAITLAVAEKHVAAGLSWSTTGSYDYYIILRDGVAVGRTTDSAWTDNLSVGKHTYVVRGVVASSDAYTDSDAVVAIIAPRYAAISSIDDISWVYLIYKREGPPVHTASRSRDVSAVHYSGRKLPVLYSGGFEDAQHQISYMVKTRAVAESIKALEGKTVVYKDWRGDLIIGVLSAVSLGYRTRGIDLEMVIQECDYSEAVSYD